MIDYEPIFSTLDTKAQSCDSSGNCYYCYTIFEAPRIISGSSFTITGAGSVTYNDPDDTGNPYNGTFDLNGVYTHNITAGTWAKDNNRLLLEMQYGQAAVLLNILPLAEWGTTPGAPNGTVYYTEYLWTVPSGVSAYDIQNMCGAATVTSDNYISGYPFYPGITNTGTPPTLIWSPDNTNRTLCNNAGGVYAGVYHLNYPGYCCPTSDTEYCLIYTFVPDGPSPEIIGSDGSLAGCSVPSSPSGYIPVNEYIEYQEGYCCNDFCQTYWTDCSETLSADNNPCPL